MVLGYEVHVLHRGRVVHRGEGCAWCTETRDEACTGRGRVGSSLFKGCEGFTVLCSVVPWAEELSSRDLGGRKQVNKALHTCTSWYAYAAMFGSSIDTMVPRALQRMYRLHLCLPSYPLQAVFCRPRPLACMSRYGGLRSTGGWTGLQYAGTQSANLSFRPTALTKRRSVVCVCV